MPVVYNMGTMKDFGKENCTWVFVKIFLINLVQKLSINSWYSWKSINLVLKIYAFWVQNVSVLSNQNMIQAGKCFSTPILYPYSIQSKRLWNKRS